MRIGPRDLALTVLDKVFFHRPGIKGDIVACYVGARRSSSPATGSAAAAWTSPADVRGLTPAVSASSGV